MAEAILSLSLADRREVLAVAADRLEPTRALHLLEKDVWVVWALETLFASPYAEQLVFKGGTSLSKAYRLIERFSEDVDLTYDIRALIPDLVRDAEDALPASRSEAQRWTEAVREALPAWVERHARPVIEVALQAQGIAAEVRQDGPDLFLDYTPGFSGTGYVSPSVKLEFGARSTGEPNRHAEVVCYADGVVEDIVFPKSNPRVMAAERTFWEKATACHVYCAQERLRGDRFSRHWHDLIRLDQGGVATLALEDRALADAVARHKAWFFREKDVAGEVVSYREAVEGGLQLVPTGEGRDRLADDYGRMVEDGLLETRAESFDQLMERCAALEDRANAERD